MTPDQDGARQPRLTAAEILRVMRDHPGSYCLLHLGGASGEDEVTIHAAEGYVLKQGAYPMLPDADAFKSMVRNRSLSEDISVKVGQGQVAYRPK